MTAVLKNLRCGDCARLLARAAGSYDLQIKCTRCGVLNHMKAESLSTDRPERLDKGSSHEQATDPRRRPDHSADPAGRQLRRPHH
ncbi:Com family DNA-binding transcriptional regulator [Stenotrophomonas rhizophila]